MGRWPAGGQERLQRAAIELFAEHGYDRTTVAEITARAGLTERTFYNHFADKREVLFPGERLFIAEVVEALEGAPAGRPPLDMIIDVLAAPADWFDRRRDEARRRRRILDAHPELRERELTKMAALGAAVADALRAREVPDPDATLTATCAVTAYQLGTARWLDDPERRGLAGHLRSAAEDLRETARRW